MTQDDRREQLARLLDAFSADDERYRRAAAMLRGAPNGRPARDDADSLATMREMLECGMAKSIEHAARMTATGLTGEASIEAATTRLAKKFRMKIFVSVPLEARDAA